MKKIILSIIVSTGWISISEFVRNSVLLREEWIAHYSDLGLSFPEDPVNGAVWGVWSLCYAIAIFIISKKFSLVQTTFLAWFVGFVFMWLVVGNLGVLPLRVLPFAVPLSLLEAFLASFIIFKLSPRENCYSQTKRGNE